MACQLSADDAFGPAVHGCRGNFDFTLLFEQSFFQIAPCALLLLLVPLRASQLHRQNVKTLRTGMQGTKQSAIAVLAATQLASLVLWSMTPMYRTRASIPAATLSFLACLALLFLSSMEHTRSIRPSSIINTYILFSLLFDITQARTLWLRSGPRSVPALFTLGIASKTVILYLEARSKRRSLFPHYRVYAPESLVSLYDRAVLWWLNPLFLHGYRSLLSFERLYKIDADLSSEDVETSFHRLWTKGQNAGGKRPLLWAMTISLRETLLALTVPRLFLSAFKLSQPLLINRVTSVLSSRTSERSIDAGRGLIGATVLIYLGLAMSNALYKRQLHRLLTKIRGTAVTAVHYKALVLPSDKVSDNAALTLMTTDVNRICFSLQRLDDLFFTPIEVGVAVFLLERQIGVSCVAPVAFSMAISIISFVNSNTAVPMQKAWLASVQERVSYTASVLGCPKGFKMLGLTNYLSDCIQALRVKELVDYAQYRKYVTHRNALSGVPKAFAPPLTLMMFTLLNGGAALNPTVAFTTLSLVALLTAPIQEIIHAVPMFHTALASLDRIQAFLLLDSNTAKTTQPRHGDLAQYGESEEAIESDTASTTEKHAESQRKPVLSIQGGEIRLGKEKKLILQDIHVVLLPGTLNLVVGPVGSGKSTLLQALIGDIELHEGQRSNDKSFPAYAYCAQDPWLPNDTFRNLILGQSDLDPQWYSNVVQACALNADINTFPLGDETVIGTKGVSLSGGQRSRLALARALYSRKKVLVIDDVLSGLDANTSQAVFDRVLGQQGLCKWLGITVAFATHAVQHLRGADFLIALGEDRKIAEQGTFQDLDSRKGYVHSLNLKGSQANQSDEEEVGEPVKPVSASDNLANVQQDLARRTGDIAVYKYYAKSIGWSYGSIIMITALTFALGTTMPDLWVRFWSEAEVIGHPRYSLGLWIGIYFLFGVICIVSIFIHIWVMLVNSVPKSSAQLHRQLLTAVMRAPYSFFVNTDSGVTLNRFSNDMSLIEGEMAGAVMQTLDGSCL